jgi:hypothetical protein
MRFTFDRGVDSSASTTACSKILLQSPKFLFSHKISGETVEKIKKIQANVS